MHVFTFVSFCCLRLCYVHLCTIFHDSHVHATSPPCSRAVAQARPRMSCIRLVYIYCHSLGNWIGLSAPGLQFIQASYTADTWSGRAARVLTISDHVMYNFRTSTWVNLVTPFYVTRAFLSVTIKIWRFLIWRFFQFLANSPN